MTVEIQDTAPVTAELASEHHERITEAEHEAEAAADQAEAAAARLQALEGELANRAPLVHEHPDYVTHDQLGERMTGLREELTRTADAAEDAADAARAAVDETPAEGGTDELPLPEPPPQPEYRNERRHGRYHKVRNG